MRGATVNLYHSAIVTQRAWRGIRLIHRLFGVEHKAELHYGCTKLAEEIAEKQGCTIGLDIVCLVTELLFRFYQVLATDLECFAKHARRTTINVDDVLCFVRRNPQLLKTLSDHHKQQTVRKKVSLTSFVGSSRSKAKVIKASDCKPDGTEKLAVCTPDSSASLTEWFNTND
ncbi:centromere protein S [Paragonimus westermani]|uniref:Centromere protein S n=1 Tax=Paragonimus westermani TaxID=34504 RepID=A0A5J4NAB6_9TREM|nr:centromere protein S [Paragonimus westermani]